MQQALAANWPKDRLRALIATQLRQIETTPALPAILHSRELNVDNAILREKFRGLSGCSIRRIWWPTLKV